MSPLPLQAAAPSQGAGPSGPPAGPPRRPAPAVRAPSTARRAPRSAQGPPARRSPPPPSGRNQPPPPDPNDPTAGRGTKQFVIKKGRRRSEDDDYEEETPIGAVMLPKSITQEAEGENFKKRFGVEEAIDLTQRHGKVRLTDSMGTLGPDMKKKGFALLLFLLLLAVGAFAIHVKIGWPVLIQKLTGGG